jgi:methanogenic corrinoid protein MtbC1
LLAGDAEAADRVVRAAMDLGLTAAEIDTELITPALFSVGEKWATGEISVADEHLASEIALRVLALQRAVLKARRERRNRRVLLLAPEGERHVIGLNMACDLLYAAGYDTLMLGADVPLADVVPAAIRHSADVVAFSATMAETNERLDAAIDHLRTSGHRAGIVLGGTAVSFEVAAMWNLPVCRDVSSVVDTVDALVQRAPLN